MSVKTQLQGKTTTPGKPPKDISSRDLFLKLASKGQPSEVITIDIPSNDGWQELKLRIQVLTYEEQEACRLAARQALLSKKGISPEHITDESYSDATACEVLARSICEVDNGQEIGGKTIYPRVFLTADELKKSLSADIVAKLFDAYSIVQNNFGMNPYASHVAENLSQWIEAIAEGAEALPFIHRLPSGLVEQIILGLATEYKTISRLALSGNTSGVQDASFSNAISSSIKESVNTSKDSGAQDNLKK